MNESPNQPRLYGEYLNDLGALPRTTGISAYVLGFAFSLVLTYAAYMLATRHALGSWLMLALAGLAILQFATQSVYFLHLGPHMSRARATVFFIALAIVVIVVGGSVWIMASLNGRMMPNEAQMMQYMQNEDAF